MCCPKIVRPTYMTWITIHYLSCWHQCRLTERTSLKSAKKACDSQSNLILIFRHSQSVWRKEVYKKSIKTRSDSTKENKVFYQIGYISWRFIFHNWSTNSSAILESKRERRHILFNLNFRGNPFFKEPNGLWAMARIFSMGVPSWKLWLYLRSTLFKVSCKEFKN